MHAMYGTFVQQTGSSPCTRLYMTNVGKTPLLGVDGVHGTIRCRTRCPSSIAGPSSIAEATVARESIFFRRCARDSSINPDRNTLFCGVVAQPPQNKKNKENAVVIVPFAERVSVVPQGFEGRNLFAHNVDSNQHFTAKIRATQGRTLR